MPPTDLDAFVDRYFDELRILTSGTRRERIAAEDPTQDQERASDWFLTALRTPQGAEEAWPVILALLERAPDDLAIAFVAAGPLEDLIRDHGPRFLDRLEAQARTSARFRGALSGVWGWEDMTPELPERLFPILGWPATSVERARPEPGGRRARARAPRPR